MVRHVEMMIAGGAFELAIISENSFSDVDQTFRLLPFLLHLQTMIRHGKKPIPPEVSSVRSCFQSTALSI